MAAGFLEKERSIAPPGFNRWLVPPAALAIHLSIGQVYSYSVFKIPLTRVIGVTQSAPGDWRGEQIAIMFSIAIAVLGLSAALFGRWLERVGPRMAMFVAAVCFGSGFLISAFGIRVHQLWFLYVGYGVVGGIGLGLGYLAPVATLIRWFPDRPGLATGLAIMGFGGGGMIGSPLTIRLMQAFRSPTSVGAAQAMVAMGIIYFCFMMFGVFMVRIPAANWKPAGWTPPAKPAGLITSRDLSVRGAMRAPQFWLLWLVLCTNTTAGIGILEQASPMIQEMFRGRVTELAAGGFVGILSLFNMLGLLFVAIAALLISMYGGGFSTMPAFVRDLFGSADFSPIYGRILTAWSVAGVAGPLLVNYVRRYRLSQGVNPTSAYSTVLYVMAGLLVIGLISNLLIRPVSERLFNRDAEFAAAPGARSQVPT